MESAAHAEPDWDLTPYFEDIDSADYQGFRADLERDIAGLSGEIEERGELTAADVDAWADLLRRLEDLHARLTHLAGYVGCRGAAESRDERVQREGGSLARLRASFAKVFVTVRAALGACDDATFAELLEDARLAEVTYFVERLRQRARWSMSTELERLTSDLGVDGFDAWGRLYGQVTGKLEFDFAPAGREPERRPVAQTRSLMEDPDPEVRRAAFDGANVAWQSVADTAAACLNAIAGTRLTLYERRGVEHFLDPALFDAGITRKTLDTMLVAVDARSDVPRRYLKRKAALLGKSKLAFEDLLAPLPLEDPQRIPWDAACARVQGAFSGHSEDLGELARRAFDGRWIDWSPRPGKRPGGFCSTSPLLGESRVFMTYDGALGDLRTLAHELGHAYHGQVMRDMRPWARRYPMTLAESASTYAEQVFTDAVLEDPDASADEKTQVLDSRLAFAAVFLLNIPVRFRFEQAFYAERAAGEVSVSRLCDLMLEAQREVFGDALDPERLNPWMWASTLHFFITDLSFYNFPYTFGYLFSLGLYARAQAEGAAFQPKYVDLLRWTGRDSAERVAQRCLGVDLEAPDYWNASIDLVEADLARFEAETEKR